MMRTLFGRRGHDRGTSAEQPHAPVTALAPERVRRIVVGRIVSVDERAASENTPALVARVEAADGDQTRLVWLGRRGIRGIQVGARLRAHGLATTVKATPTIYNPHYDLLLADDTASGAGSTAVQEHE